MACPRVKGIQPQNRTVTSPRTYPEQRVRGFLDESDSSHNQNQETEEKLKNINSTVGALALASTLAAATLTLLIAKSSAYAAGRNFNPRVLPINSTPYGKSYAEWSAE